MTAFADTSYYIALLNPHDNDHLRAAQLHREFKGNFLTTEFVILELGNWLCDDRNRGVFVMLVDSLRSDARTEIVPATTDLIQRGLDLYRSRRDKTWSLTDCISFVVMAEHRVTDVLTGDRHFVQAGFRTMFAE